ncbi:MAG: DUF63 family protein, partial [Methermicoccaceae archaeon]
PVNTITWAIILAVSLLMVYRLLQKMGITPDNRFLPALLPYIIMGPILRVVEDAGLVSPPLSYLLITPLIYFLVFAITMTCLVLFYKRNILQFVIVGSVVDVILLGVLLTSNPVSWWVTPLVFGMGTLVFLPFFMLRKRFSILKNPVNLAVLWCHMLDATSTFIGVDFLGYVEKHVVPRLLISTTGTAAVMYPLKITLLLVALYIIEDMDIRMDFKQLLRLTLIVIGLAPAIRDTLRMTLGT